MTQNVLGVAPIHYFIITVEFFNPWLYFYFILLKNVHPLLRTSQYPLLLKGREQFHMLTFDFADVFLISYCDTINKMHLKALLMVYQINKFSDIL